MHSARLFNRQNAFVSQRSSIVKRFFKSHGKSKRKSRIITKIPDTVPKELQIDEGSVLLYRTERPALFRGLVPVLLSSGVFSAYLTFLCLNLKENDDTNVIWYIYNWRQKLFGGGGTVYDDIEEVVPVVNPLAVEAKMVQEVEPILVDTNIPVEAECSTVTDSTAPYVSVFSKWVYSFWAPETASAHSTDKSIDVLSDTEKSASVSSDIRESEDVPEITAEEIQELIAIDNAQTSVPGELVAYWKRALLASFFVSVQGITLGLAYVIPRRTVAQLTLTKGGSQVAIERFSMFGPTTTTTVATDTVKALRTKAERNSAGAFMPVRVGESFPNYLIDMGGEILNAKLFDKVLRI
eukprot:CFRG4392T1